MLIGRKNETLESINNSIQQNVRTRPLDEANCKFLTKKRENGYDYQEQR